MSGTAGEARELLRLLVTFRRRLRQEVLLRGLLRGGSAGLSLVALIAIAARLLQRDIPGEALVAALTLPMLVALAITLLRWPSTARTARVADRRLDLKERLATAVELVERGAHDEASGLARIQISDASRAAQSSRDRWPSPLSHVRRELMTTAALAGLVASLVFWPGLEEPAPLPPDRPTDTPAIGAPSDASSESENEETRPDATEPEEAGTEPSNASLSPDAVSEDEAGGLSDEQREAFDRLGEALDQISAGRAAAEQIEQGNYEAAAEELANLGAEADQLSDEAKEQLADALREFAEDFNGDQPELTEAAERAADALEGDDYDEQREALTELGQALEDAANGTPPDDQLAAQDGADGDGEDGAQGAGDGADSGDQQAGDDGGSQAGTGDGAGDREGQDGESGAGDGEDGGSDVASDEPDAEANGASERQRAAALDQPRRLDALGEPDEIPARLLPDGASAGAADESDPELLDEGQPSRAAGGPAGIQDTGSVSAEYNRVPRDRQQVVRNYFNGQ
jgi:hypothetical protein